MNEHIRLRRINPRLSQRRAPGGNHPRTGEVLAAPDKPLARVVHPDQLVQQEVAPETILVVDIGGSKVKVIMSGQAEPLKIPSGKRLKPGPMVEAIHKLTAGWHYQAVSIGFPGLVGDHGPRAEPSNLGPGWVGFDFATAFKKPVRILNDAALQALGSYEGGRMLYLTFGTSLGSTLIAGNVLFPLELGYLMLGSRKKLGDIAGDSGMKRVGKRAWRRSMLKVIENLFGAFNADYVVLGGGNARKLAPVAAGVRLGHKLTALRGGIRLWQIDDVRTQTSDQQHVPSTVGQWKVV